MNSLIIKGFYTDRAENPYKAKLYLQFEGYSLMFEIGGIVKIADLPTNLNRFRYNIVGKEVEKIKKDDEFGFVVKIKGHGYLHLFCSVTISNKITVGVDVLETQDAQNDNDYLSCYENDIKKAEIQDLWLNRIIQVIYKNELYKYL